MDMEQFNEAKAIVDEIEKLESAKRHISKASQLGISLTLQDEKGTYIKSIDLPKSVNSLLKDDIIAYVDNIIDSKKDELESL